MEKTPKTQSSRRKFLSLGLLTSASLITPAAAQGIESEDTETIKMLTPDGKLVEVKKSVVAKSENRSKARNEDILKWSTTANKAK